MWFGRRSEGLVGTIVPQNCECFDRQMPDDLCDWHLIVTIVISNLSWLRLRSYVPFYVSRIVQCFSKINWMSSGHEAINVDFYKAELIYCFNFHSGRLNPSAKFIDATFAKVHLSEVLYTGMQFCRRNCTHQKVMWILHLSHNAQPCIMNNTVHQANLTLIR